MNQYHVLLDELRAIFRSNPDVNTITTLDGADIDIDKKTIYPLVNILARQSSIALGLTTFTVDIDVLDIRDESCNFNETELTEAVNQSVGVLNKAVRELLPTVSEQTIIDTLNTLKSKVEDIYTTKFIGEDNADDNLNLTLSILTKAVKKISLSDKISISLPVTATSGTLRLMNLLDGWSASLQITVDNRDVSKCEQEFGT